MLVKTKNNNLCTMQPALAVTLWNLHHYHREQGRFSLFSRPTFCIGGDPRSESERVRIYLLGRSTRPLRSIDASSIRARRGWHLALRSQTHSCARCGRRWAVPTGFGQWERAHTAAIMLRHRRPWLCGTTHAATCAAVDWCERVAQPERRRPMVAISGVRAQLRPPEMASNVHQHVWSGS